MYDSDIFNTAATLPDNDLIVVRFEFSNKELGKIQLSNKVNELNDIRKKNLLRLLKILEIYITDYYIIPSNNTSV